MFAHWWQPHCSTTVIFPYLQWQQTAGFSEQFLFLHPQKQWYMYWVYLFISDCKHSEFMFLCSEVRGLQMSISNHVNFFFLCENYKSLISTYMHHRSTSTLFPALHSSVLAFLYRRNFCQISNTFCAFSHVEVECIFTLYHLFSSHPEVYSKYSSVLRNTFPMESESLD